MKNSPILLPGLVTVTFISQNSLIKKWWIDTNCHILVKEDVSDWFEVIPTLKFKHYTSVIVLAADEFYLIMIVIIITWTKCLCGDLPSGCILYVSETVVMSRSSFPILFYVKKEQKQSCATVL